MSRQRPDAPVEDFVGFLDEVSTRQEEQELEEERLGAALVLSTPIRILLTLPSLVALGLLLWVAGRFDLWLSPGWIVLTATVWLVCVFFARIIWAPAGQPGKKVEARELVNS